MTRHNILNDKYKHEILNLIENSTNFVTTKQINVLY